MQIMHLFGGAVVGGGRLGSQRKRARWMYVIQNFFVFTVSLLR